MTREDRFSFALDRLSNAVAITCRMERPPDGKPHKLEVRARREGVVIRTAPCVVAGTPEAAAAARSIEALVKPAAAGNLPLQVGVNLIEVRKNNRRVGELRVSADLAEIAGPLERVGPGRGRSGHVSRPRLVGTKAVRGDARPRCPGPGGAMTGLNP